jgi:hypothetical protein
VFDRVGPGCAHRAHCEGWSQGGSSGRAVVSSAFTAMHSRTQGESDTRTRTHVHAQLTPCSLAPSHGLLAEHGAIAACGSADGQRIGVHFGVRRMYFSPFSNRIATMFTLWCVQHILRLLCWRAHHQLSKSLRNTCCPRLLQGWPYGWPHSWPRTAAHARLATLARGLHAFFLQTSSRCRCSSEGPASRPRL